MVTWEEVSFLDFIHNRGRRGSVRGRVHLQTLPTAPPEGVGLVALYQVPDHVY